MTLQLQSIEFVTRVQDLKFCNVVENFCYLSRMSWKVAKKKYRRHCLTFCRSYRICIHQCTFFPRTLRPRCDFLVCVCFFLCSKLSYCSGFPPSYTLQPTYLQSRITKVQTPFRVSNICTYVQEKNLHHWMQILLDL